MLILKSFLVHDFTHWWMTMMRQAIRAQSLAAFSPATPSKVDGIQPAMAASSLSDMAHGAMDWSERDGMCPDWCVGGYTFARDSAAGHDPLLLSSPYKSW